MIFITICCAATLALAKTNLAISSAPTNLDPFYGTDGNSQNISRLTHGSLVDLNESMEFICMLCESFEEYQSQGKYYLKFKLRGDIKFWDGSAVKVEDVKRSVEWFQSDEIKSVYRFAFRKIKEIKTQGDEVVFQYNSYSMDHLSDLVLLKILKKKNSEYIGSGKYRIESRSELNIKLEALSPELEDLEFKVVKDATTLALKIVNKEIDVSLHDLTPRKLTWLAKNSKIKIIEKEGTNFKYINFNHSNELLSKQKVRKAISLLIPREELVKYKLQGVAKLSKGILSEPFKNYYSPYGPDKLDRSQAEQLLDEAGLLEKNGRRFKINWLATNNRASLEVIYFIIKSLNQSGIEVDLTTQEWGTFMKSIKKGAFDMYMSQWIGFTGPGILNYIIHSKKVPPKGANRGLYINAKLDNLLDRGESSLEIGERARYYKEAQDIINKDYAYINLWHPKVVWVTQNCINIDKIYPTGSFLSLLSLKNNCHGK